MKGGESNGRESYTTATSIEGERYDGSSTANVFKRGGRDTRRLIETVQEGRGSRVEGERELRP